MTPPTPAPTPGQRTRCAAALDALAPAGRLLVAVSGGADSLGLLLLAAAARPGAIAAATVDHRLREGSAAEARAVAAMCDGLGVPHATLAVDVPRGRHGLQAAARAARYAALGGHAAGIGAAAVATAHHIDDQAETLLMRLARGAGAGGLAGVRPRRGLAPGIDLVRPLLGWRRAELAAIVAAAGLSALDDPSNRDPRHDRTRARALLAHAGWLDPGRLAAAADHLRDADEALAWAAAAEYARRAEPAPPGVTLDAAGLPAELRRRVVRLALDAVTKAAGGGDAHPCTGPELTGMIARLDAGLSATLGVVLATPGPRWRLTTAPSRRTG